MARPRKKGLDYFPLDVNIFDDDKLFDVQNEFGPLGETVYLRLVCMVYKNGYYFKFDSIEKLAAMVIRSIGSRWVESKREIVEIIRFLIDCGLFSKRFANMNILTSKGIQLRFKLATERRRSGIIEYSLLDGGEMCEDNVHNGELEESISEENIHEYNVPENDSVIDDYQNSGISDTDHQGNAEDNNSEMYYYYGYNMSDFNDYFANNTYNSNVTNNAIKEDYDTEIVSVNNNAGLCCNNPTKKSKVNKSKLKESRENESISDTAAGKCGFSSTEKIVKIFNGICKSLPKVTKITSERIRAVNAASDKINGDFEGLFYKVEQSDFLTGRNGKWLNCSFDWIFKPCNLVKILSGNYDNYDYSSHRSGSFYFSNVYENEKEYYEELQKLSPCY
ncbi:MAG: DUF4373 domain-containing protein [Clostridia bacterium]|nr:DUF4373 domain-containing protein [Clostridia bacterium]